jgi:hypothetical protein
VFTSALHWSLSWARSILSIAHHPISLRSNLILSSHLHLGLPSGLYPFGSPTKILHAFLFSPMCYMVCSSHPFWPEHSNYTWWRILVTTLIMQFYPTSYHFIPLWSKYFQHSFHKHPQSMFFPWSQRLRFTPIQNHRQIYSFVYSYFYVLDSRREDRRLWIEW